MADPAVQDPTAATRGMPLLGAAFKGVPTPVPTQVASPVAAPAPATPVAALPSLADSYAGPTSLALADNARQAYGQGQYLQAGVGALAAGGAGIGHVVKSGLDYLGQADHDSIASVGRSLSYATGQVAQGLGLQPRPAPAGPSAGFAGQGPAYDPAQNMVSPFGVTFNRATGPTLDQAKQIAAASDASVAGIPAGDSPLSATIVGGRGSAAIQPGVAGSIAPAPGQGMPAAGGQGQSVIGAYTTPVQVARTQFEQDNGLKAGAQAYLLTHPSLAAAAGIGQTMAATRGTQQTNDLNATAMDAFKQEYNVAAAKPGPAGETAADRQLRLLPAAIQLATRYGTLRTPAYGAASLTTQPLPQ